MFVFTLETKDYPSFTIPATCHPPVISASRKLLNDSPPRTTGNPKETQYTSTSNHVTYANAPRTALRNPSASCSRFVYPHTNGQVSAWTSSFLYQKPLAATPASFCLSTVSLSSSVSLPHPRMWTPQKSPVYFILTSIETTDFLLRSSLIVIPYS
jgi:hypothetical protein